MTPQDPTMPKALHGRDKDVAWLGFLLLSGLFIASLVTCNLVFRKFFTWDMGAITFEQSVGLLPYPITFLVTDMISEIYGKRKANFVVMSGLAASIMTLGVVTVGGWAEATAWSPVSNSEFDHVFGQTALAVGASMAAYLLAQFIDVRIFHFWKSLTHGKAPLAQEQPVHHPIPNRGHLNRPGLALCSGRNRLGTLWSPPRQWRRLQIVGGRFGHAAGLPRRRMDEASFWIDGGSRT